MGKLYDDQDGNGTQRGRERQPSPLEQRLKQLRSAASAGRSRVRLAGIISVWQVINMILDVVTVGVLIYAVLDWEEFSFGLVSHLTQLLSVALTFMVLAVLGALIVRFVFRRR